jgi:hypothetical protein
MEIFVLAFLVACVCSGVGAYVSAQKERGATEGAVFGFLLGPFGVLIAALLPTPIRRRNTANPYRGGRARSVGTPEYRDNWDAPPPERKPDRTEDEAMRYLTDGER